MREYLQILSQCPLFKGIAHEELPGLMTCLEARRTAFCKGSVILAEGDLASCLGVVLTGSVQVLRVDYYGNRSIIAKLAAGDIFAETIACAGMERMPVSVLAETDAQVLLIEAKRIIYTCDKVCGFHQQLVTNLIHALAAKNLVCQQKIEVTSKRTTREKLMAYLLSRAKTAGRSDFSIPYDRQELADYLEVDRSGLSAEISKLRREGVLECHKNQFILLNKNPLL